MKEIKDPLTVPYSLVQLYLQFHMGNFDILKKFEYWNVMLLDDSLERVTKKH